MIKPKKMGEEENESTEIKNEETEENGKTENKKVKK